MENGQLKFAPEHFDIEPGTHHDKSILWIKFDKDFQKIELLKSVTKPKFSWSQKMWYVTDNTFNRILFGLQEKVFGKAA